MKGDGDGPKLASRPRLPMSKRALIVGGGIAGLASAIALCRAGWQVTVLERAPHFASVGTGMAIWPEALRVLDLLGLGEMLRNQGQRQTTGVICRPDGQQVATIDAGRIERKAGEPVYLVSRPALIAMLYQALPGGVVRFSTEVTEPAALWPDYDVVVGADGVNSRVRGVLFGRSYGLQYSGATAWRGVIEFDSKLRGETWGRGKKFCFNPQEPGRMDWYAALQVSEEFEPADGDMHELRRQFGTWHEPIPQILRHIKPDVMLRHPICHLDRPLPSYVRGNAALIGDAAHPMPPDLGLEACHALIDGFVLGDCLRTSEDSACGLQAYDRKRRRPTQRIAALALRTNRMSLATHFSAHRDVASRTVLPVISLRA